MYKSESGRSMIEMLGVLAIMAIITAAAVTMWPRLMNQTSRMKVQDDVYTISLDVRKLMSGYEDLSNLDGNMVFKAIGMSQNNPYGGKYEIAVDSANARQFVVSITGLPTKDCEYFRLAAWRDSVDYTKSNGKQSGAIAMPSDCSDAAGNNTIAITFAQ
ncbi:MAG: hypothetical protein LBB23_00330 [Rickettsiales bacterium]|jgi:Tfp pilus assembly protein PilE|nr:hypothetical protein [Rickettsiales bacterium]